MGAQQLRRRANHDAIIAFSRGVLGASASARARICIVFAAYAVRWHAPVCAMNVCNERVPFIVHYGYVGGGSGGGGASGRERACSLSAV